MPASDIVIRGAREHNLQDVSLTLPRNQLIVMTGVSGSGKSSLAFDTLYAEGQRRYVESLSSYARQFLGQMPKPDVDSITGLAPSISIQQKASGRNPRSTVGTITEIYDYLRVLFARVGTPSCYQCGRPITAQTREHILDSVLRLPEGTKYQVLAPLVQRQKGEFKDLFIDLLKRGFLRARVDGKLVQLTDDLQLDKQMKHTIDVVVDRLIAGKTPRARVAEAIEAALNLADRKLVISREAEREFENVDSAETASSASSSNQKGRVAKGKTSTLSIASEIATTRKRARKSDARDQEVDVSVAFPDADVTAHVTAETDQLYSCDYACTHCGISYEQPSPQLFSFNSPQGMCPDCQGLGIRFDFAPDRLVPDDSLSVQKGAIVVLGKLSSVGKWRKHILKGVARAIEIDLGLSEDSFFKTKWRDLPAEGKRLFLYGLGSRNITFAYRNAGNVWKRGGTYAGFIPELLEEYRKTRNPMRRVQLEKYMHETGCASCGGSRLNKQAGSYTITSHSSQAARDERRGYRKGESHVASQEIVPASLPLSLSLPELCSLSTLAAWEFFGELDLSDTGRFIASEAIKEIRGRLGFLLRCGLDYLTLDRTAPTLSGGESQRIRLAGQIGCGLVGVVYILDEPSIGLHPRDNVMLLDSLKDLRDQGNTVIVVEHDDETMLAADHLVDFGPGPGVRGGEVVVEGSVDDVKRSKRSLTGAFLSHRRAIEVPKIRREGNGHAIEIHGATHHNLRDVSASFPLGKFICVTGVSGSGKSSLVNDILWEVLNRDINKGTGHPGEYAKISGLEHVDKAIDIDQSPIGRTPRSNPATYVKLFDLIRDLYTQLPESKMRGFKPGRFSFNVAGGRCEACEGNGSNKLEMDFLADIWVTCPVCQGKRFNKETLEVRFKGKNINDVLEMDIQQGLEHFEHHPKLMKSLQTLHDVGMDYVKLGQPSPTLSGGEAQRIKLAKELSKRSTGQTVYILDEPTTGLHFVDIEHLLRVLHGFVDAGNTVIVVEHNLDVIKTADWVIDLGPEGGSGGGRILVEGPPEEIARCEESYTGRALRAIPGFESVMDRAKKKKGKAKAAAINPLTAHPASRWQTLSPLKETTNGADTSIVVRGAAQHNLQHLDLNIPRDQMSVFCGPSGSGKSSLAMDTLYAEGQRRYVESLSSYARHFLGQMPKPRVEHIHGLQPSIAIEQKTVGNTPRSTVGTVTEIYDYLRILFARLGTQFCPDCGIAVKSQTVDDVIDRLLQLSDEPSAVADGGQTSGDSGRTRVMILAPQEVTVGQHYSKLWERLKEQGFRRVRVDGVTYLLEEVPEIDRKRRHQVEIVIDRVTIAKGGRSRLAESVELAFDHGKGLIRVAVVDDGRDEKKWKVLPFSLFRACEQCGRSFEELAPHNFSFNSPLGWCEACEGIGIQQGTNLGALISDQTRSLSAGAVSAWPDPARSPLFRRMLAAMAHECDIPLDVPFSQLESHHQQAVLFGTGETWIPLTNIDTSAPSKTKRKAENSATPSCHFQYKGLYPSIEQAASLSYDYRVKLFGLVGDVPCSSCNGSRLREDASAVKLAGKTVKQLCDLPLREALEYFDELQLTAAQKKIAGDLLTEATSRLRFLVDVGLHYLTLARTLPTLSGGETQRIRLAGQIGRALTGVLYVLDEPTIGLHPSDNGRLLSALIKLRDLGNTIIMVEHDREVIQAADRLYDFGPGAGRFGGTITAQGSPQEINVSPESLTGKYLSSREEIVIPAQRRLQLQQAEQKPAAAEIAGRKSTTKKKGSQKAQVVETEADSAAVQSDQSTPASNLDIYELPPGGGWLELLGARHHNLRNVDLRIPLGTFTAITGVSGSGKSSLIDDTLARAVAHKLHRASTQPGPYDELNGLQLLSKLIVVDQQPLGTTPASNPATYTGVFEHIRELFARMPDAKVRGYSATRFSFNRSGGRCEACEGNGQKLIEMHFLPDVWVECDVCRGKRYNAETLAVTYRGQSIADVLEMSIGQALELFDNIPKIRGPLSVLAAIGLDYLTLGQSAPTLSGGEAQRVKLAAELSRPQTGKTLYLLDEPTTGLHFDDIRKLLKILNSLVDAGNTVVVIEHNLDVIKTADWIIDVGPRAGSEGGWIVAQGTPEDVVNAARDVQLNHDVKGTSRVAAKPSGSSRRKTAAVATAPLEMAHTTSEHDIAAPVHRSLTGEILADVLATGKYGERESFDAEAARKKRSGDMDPNKIGADAKMPWEVNGRQWHTVEGLANNGRPRRWKGEILSTIVEQLEADDAFAPTNWNDRSTVEIMGKSKAIGWFFHGLTGDEWLLTLKLRVPKKTFEEATLAAQLDLKDVNDLDHIAVYNRQPRVRVRPSSTGPFDDVTISILEAGDIQTPAFTDFLATARRSFIDRTKPEALNLDDLTPWKKLGRKWHLMRKGFSQGAVEWEPALLEQLETLVNELRPDVVIDWTQKVVVNFSIDKTNVASMNTKRPAGLDFAIVVPRGSVQFGEVAGFGVEPTISSQKLGVDTIELRFTKAEQLKTAALRKFLIERWVNAKVIK